MKRYLLVGFLMFGVHIMFSCNNSLVVTVVDESNKPISGANAVIQGMSTQCQQKETKVDGKAIIKKKEILGAKFIMVSKDGYDSQWINLSQPCPEIVVLKKKNGIRSDNQ